MWDILNASEILPQRFNPEFGAATEWKSNAVANKVYMIQDRDYDSNVDTDYILSLQAEWDAERESYATRLKAMILILQYIWRHYQVKTRKNTLKAMDN